MKRLFLSSLFPLLACCTCLFGAPASDIGDLPRLVSQAARIQAGQDFQAFRSLEALVRQSGSVYSLRKPVTAALIHLLDASATFEARQFACKQLGIIGNSDALPALGRLLQDDQTAGIACLALSTYPSGKADRLLRKSLPYAHGRAEIQIINTLGSRRDPDSLRLLTRLAKSNNRPTAEAAINALGNLGTRSALKVLAALHAGVDQSMRSSVTRAVLVCADRLATVGDRKTPVTAYEVLLATPEPLTVRRAALAALFRLDRDYGQARILKTLRGTDASLKPVAIAAIDRLPQPNASRLFASEFPHLTPSEQVCLLQALAARGDMPAIDAVNQAISSSDPSVRRAAIEAAGALTSATSAPMLIRALSECTETDDARAIETALVTLSGGTTTDEQILRAIANSSGPPRAHLVNAISLRQGAAANGLLFTQAESADTLAAKAALRALTRTALDTDVPRLVSEVARISAPEVRSEAESAARKTLPLIQPPAHRSELVVAAISKAETTAGKSALFSLLPSCADANGLAEINRTLANSEIAPSLRTAAIETLADWPDDSAWQPLEAALSASPSPADRATAFRALVRLAGDQNAHATEALIQRYRLLLSLAQGDADLKLLLGTLGGAAHLEALQIALGQLEKPGVRPEAEAAVKKIAEALKAAHPKEAGAALQQVSATTKSDAQSKY